MAISIDSFSMNNLLSSLEAYADMSPDLEVREQVSQWMRMRDRQPLSLIKWCEVFSNELVNIGKAVEDSATEGVTKSVLAFVYEFFSGYTGLAFSQVRPNDRLNRDLHFPLICWFDWTLDFCDDFLARFDLDLSDCFDEAEFDTVGEVVEFLVEQVIEATVVPEVPQLLPQSFLRVTPSERAMTMAA